MTQTIINVPAAGAFDPSDITLTDDTSGALLIKEGSNEYIRINTTNGSEQMVLKGRPGSASSAGLFLTDQPFLQGSDSQFIQMTGSGVILETGATGNRLDVKAGNSGNSFRVLGTGGAERFKVLDDSNATFTLDETNAARFRIMDNGAATGGITGPITYLDIQSSTGNTATGDYIKLSLEPEANGRYFELTSTSAKLYCQNAKLDMTTSAATFTLYDDFQIRQYQTGKRILVCEDAQNSHEALTVDKTADSTFNIFAPSTTVPYAPVAGSSFKVRRRDSSATVDCLTIAPDSSLTHTLDDGSGATFTITDDASPTPALHLRCTESASPNPSIEVNGLVAFPTRQLTLTSNTYGTAFSGSANQARLSVSLGATSATRNVNIGAVSMDAFAQILTATPSTTSQTFTLDFNNSSTALSGLPISLYKLVLKNAGTESCTFTAASTMASGGRVKGVDISGASIGVIDSSSGSITAAAGETIYVEVTNHVSDSAGGLSNRFIICKTICKI